VTPRDEYGDPISPRDILDPDDFRGLSREPRVRGNRVRGGRQHVRDEQSYISEDGGGTWSRWEPDPWGGDVA
jgi:hypothetical protein